MSSLTQVTPPAMEPVALADVKAQSRITIADEDSYISTFLIPTARQHLEDFTKRQFVNSTWRMKLDAFLACSSIYFPLPPLSSVTSVQYVDTAGVTQTFAASKYTVDADSEPGRIFLNKNERWPSTDSVPNAVTIDFVAGYGSAMSDVPTKLRQAILLMCADLYCNRENSSEKKRFEIPTSAMNLALSYVIHTRITNGLRAA